MGYEGDRPAVFDRNINGWVTVPEDMDLPDNQQDRDMIARELLIKFQSGKDSCTQSQSGTWKLIWIVYLKWYGMSYRNDNSFNHRSWLSRAGSFFQILRSPSITSIPP